MYLNPTKNASSKHKTNTQNRQQPINKIFNYSCWPVANNPIVLITDARSPRQSYCLVCFGFKIVHGYSLVGCIFWAPARCNKTLRPGVSPVQTTPTTGSADDVGRKSTHCIMSVWLTSAWRHRQPLTVCQPQPQIYRDERERTRTRTRKLELENFILQGL